METSTEAEARRFEQREAYLKNLGATKDELQSLVTQAEVELEKLNRNRPAHLKGPPTRHLEVMRAAFERAAAAEPLLPSRHSVLPSLLAMRRVHQTVAESRACVSELTVTVDDTRRRQLDVDTAALEDQRALMRALEARLELLRGPSSDVDMEDGEAPSAEQAKRSRMAELQREKSRYDDGAEELRQAVDKFIGDTLAVLLAAEDLGGPIVGDRMDVDDDVLAAGFNIHGKPKKAKGDKKHSEDSRQLRLDQLPGFAITSKGGVEHQTDEAAAAARELRDLLERLVQGSMEAHDRDNTVAYVAVETESAAVRFLVRARVAQFHPRDAGRLRLVDFGRELDE